MLQALPVRRTLSAIAMGLALAAADAAQTPRRPAIDDLLALRTAGGAEIEAPTLPAP